MSGGGNLPVGPGIWGFVAFFVLAVALWFLVRNMNNRLRRMAYRDRERAEEFAAKADVDGSTAAAPEPGSGAASHTASDTARRPDEDATGAASGRTDDDSRPDGEDPRR